MFVLWYMVSCNANYSGAGMYARQRAGNIEFDEHPIANNGLIVSTTGGLRVECVSNSSQSGVGEITGLDGNTLPTGNTGNLRITNPFTRPGVIRLETRSELSLSPNDQGIYTCTIPDSNNNQHIFNVGLYSNGFIYKLYY